MRYNGDNNICTWLNELVPTSLCMDVWLFVGLYRTVKSSAGYPLSLINYHHKSDSRANSDKPFNRMIRPLYILLTNTHTRAHTYINTKIYIYLCIYGECNACKYADMLSHVVAKPASRCWTAGRS